MQWSTVINYIYAVLGRTNYEFMTILLALD
jgi:hypothetical protein